ncbi:MAG: hypothetical protein NTW12_11205, partial [Deltaproteobacteria bacterium]|nr:hypothetical protein [Deltaproteobacteria bacterium]
RSQSKTHVASFLRKEHSVSPYPTIAKNHLFLYIPVIRRPIYKDVGTHEWPVSAQKGQQGSLLTCLSIEKTKKI